MPEDWFAKHDVHVHVPAGAVPKDGPSAGVTMATAIASLVRGMPVSADVGDDRRDHADRAGAADRRRAREGPGGAARGAEAGDPAARERGRPRGPSGRDAEGARFRPRRLDRAGLRRRVRRLRQQRSPAGAHGREAGGQRGSPTDGEAVEEERARRGHRRRRGSRQKLVLLLPDEDEPIAALC